MVKGKVLSNVLLAIALIASSAVVAHAGAGSGTSFPVTLAICYVIEDGANSPYVLTLQDQFGTREHVRVGKARLLCTPTSMDSLGNPDGWTVERGPELNGDFLGTVGDHLKCYDVSSRRPKGPDAVVNIIDPFGNETVELERPRLLCTPATKEVLQQNQNHHREHRDRD